MIKWNDFRGIYRFFGVKLAIEFNFGANMTVISSLNHWDQSITV